MDRVLMFSGGLDSFILKELHGFKNSECLFVRMGTEENRQEEKLLDEYFPGVLKTDMPLASFELSNKIIPFRNHFIALLGAQFSTNVYFAFTAGDTTRDKDYVFKAQMEGLLNYFAGIPEKTTFPDEVYEIFMPFKNHTKVQLVEEYIAAGNDPQRLIEYTKSCYAGKQIDCGICRSCIRKYVALTLNSIQCEELFETSPRLFLNKFYDECLHKNRKLETEEVKRCINLK
jgi:hypothetical protein